MLAIKSLPCLVYKHLSNHLSFPLFLLFRTTVKKKSSNSVLGSWVHCNDSKMTLCSWDDVNKAQAYILIYVQADMSSQFSGQEFLPQTSVFEEEADSEITFNFRNSSIPKFVELKRKLAEDAKGRLELKRRKTTMW